MTEVDTDRLDYKGAIPYAMLHVVPFAALLTGWTWFCLLCCAFSYFLRMFFITAGYHRYFAHRSFKTSRAFQFVLAAMGATAGQNGPLWWASHHRHHHRHSDTEHDPHSPGLKGFLWSHTVWFLTYRSSRTNMEAVKDLARYPELHIWERHPHKTTWIYAFCWFFFGIFIETHVPWLHTTRWQLLVWAYFVSTILLYHGTFTINSLSHLFGSRRYPTKDSSRNNFLLALITMGEGWHNNHHRYPGSERQGFFWWELDPTHYLLKVLERLGLVWDLHEPPAAALNPEPEPALR